MEWVGLVKALELLKYFWFGFEVSNARGATGIDAPAMHGHKDLEVRLRIHGNTQEQLLMWLPFLFMFAYFVGPVAAAAIGVIFPLGRQIYRSGYLAGSRSKGFIITEISTVLLFIGTLCGIFFRILMD